MSILNLSASIYHDSKEPKTFIWNDITADIFHSEESPSDLAEEVSDKLIELVKNQMSGEG